MQRTPEGHTGDDVPRLVGGSQPLKLDESAQTTTPVMSAVRQVSCVPTRMPVVTTISNPPFTVGKQTSRAEMACPWIMATAETSGYPGARTPRDREVLCTRGPLSHFSCLMKPFTQKLERSETRYQPTVLG